MIKTIHKNWLRELKSELKETNEVNIVSPFITDNIVKHLLDVFKGKTIKVITRYNLNDFRKGVSSLTALERLLKSNAEIKGIRSLHSKLYIFDEKSVIITSANFTQGGFFNNKEFGILSYDFKTIKESLEYFNSLWGISPYLLSINQVNKWKEEINKSTSIKIEKPELPDYGVSFQKTIIKDRKYFVKFFGTNQHRTSLESSVSEELVGGCSHFALSFSRSKRDARPIRYRDGDIVFLARMTNTEDYAIFGRAIAISHNRKRDVASLKDIKNIPWLADWPILIRVKNPIYINTTLAECPKLIDLTNNLDYDSFASTKRRFDEGERNINPKKSLMQKGDVILSDSGAQWMELEFKKILNKKGKVDEALILNLYNSINSKIV